MIKITHSYHLIPKVIRILLVVTCGLALFMYLLLEWNNNPVAVQHSFIYLEPVTSYFRYSHSYETKDWHDYKFIESEAARSGPGENGTAVIFTADEEEKFKAYAKENQYNAFVSDVIARDRSLLDTRDVQCHSMKYLKELPTVSIIIPFHNEVLSTLTRTIHSVINRSPAELLKEVILVNDHSTKEYCYGPLEDYIQKHFDTSKVKILVMPKRSGLMWARLAGARAAKGDVLIFLDCHVEANVNWLPPLIEPIAKNYRALVCPFIDTINKLTFKIKPYYQARGVFNWNMIYEFLPLRPEDKISKTAPVTTPIMMGCAFAISAKFFWQLGGYDTGLNIWGGEQYEMSIKTWLCGGIQYDAPCSRVGHLFRSRPFTEVDGKRNYYERNFKRVAVTWLDDYAKYVFARDPERWDPIEIGDISYMMSIKKKLNCKPFKYFLDEVAPDMLKRLPYIEPPVFASGQVQSVAYPNLCLDTLYRDNDERIGLFQCFENKTNPGKNQHILLRNHRDMFIYHSHNKCLDEHKDTIIIYSCMYGQKNQYFRYIYESKQIVCGPKRDNKCMEIDLEANTVFVSQCSEDKATQKWDWGFVNVTMLQNWIEYGDEILDETELKDLTLENSKF